MSIYDSIEEAAKELYIRALKDIPPDVREALKKGAAAETREGNQSAGQVMFTILENIKVADEHDTLVCQDTGLAIYKVRIGTRIAVDPVELKRRLRIGCERATAEYPLRSNSVHPLTRKNTHTNSGEGLPIVKLDFVPDSSVIEIHMAPKGSGSENMSFLRMLNPSDGIRGITRFVLECVFEAGARPCPPIILGVGLGGTSDLAMQLAKEASCFRKIGTSNPDPEAAKLEADLLDKINRMGLGPQGLGGATTALAVPVEWAHTHISQNPVGVNIQCWRGERAEAGIAEDGAITYGAL